MRARTPALSHFRTFALPHDPASPRRRRPLSHDLQVLRLAFLTGLPGAVVALLLLWTGSYDGKLRWTLTLLVALGWLGFALALREKVIRPLQTLSNLLAALREGDFSLRARGAGTDDALGLALLEANTLSDTLREQRVRALEATALLRRVMDEIDVVVFAFDGEERVRLANRAGERLLGQPAERILGRTAAEVGLDVSLEGESPRTLDRTFPGGTGRWEVRRAPFRQGGRTHQLLVLSDVSRVAREEEREAWRRLIRVLSHEINNSLAPIRSIAGTLQGLLGAPARPDDLDDDLRSGLTVIAGRSEALSRFMSSYARLARLPPPSPRPWTWPRGCAAPPRWSRASPCAWPPAPPSPSTRTATSWTSSSSTWCATRRTRRWRPAEGWRWGGGRRAGGWRCGWTTRGRDSPRRRTCSSPSSPPRPAEPASGWCSAARSPRGTGAR